MHRQSVWTFAASGSTVDFIQNPNEPIANRSQWLLFVPTNRIESFQNSLHRVQGNRAYLVELAGNVPARWALKFLWAILLQNLPMRFQGCDLFKIRPAHDSFDSLQLEPQLPVKQDLLEDQKLRLLAKSSVRTGTRQLIGWRVIKQLWIQGDRRDHFEADPDLGYLPPGGSVVLNTASSVSRAGIPFPRLHWPSSAQHRDLSFAKDTRLD